MSWLVTVAWRRFKNENRSEAHDKSTEPLFRRRKTCSGHWNQGVWFLTAKMPKCKKRGISHSLAKGDQVCDARPKYSTGLYYIVLYSTVLHCTAQYSLSRTSTLALEDTRLVTRLQYFIQIYVRNQYSNWSKHSPIRQHFSFMILIIKNNLARTSSRDHLTIS